MDFAHNAGIDTLILFYKYLSIMLIQIETELEINAWKEEE